MALFFSSTENFWVSLLLLCWCLPSPPRISSSNTRNKKKFSSLCQKNNIYRFYFINKKLENFSFFFFLLSCFNSRDRKSRPFYIIFFSHSFGVEFLKKFPPRKRTNFHFYVGLLSAMFFFICSSRIVSFWDFFTIFFSLSSLIVLLEKNFFYILLINSKQFHNFTSSSSMIYTGR